ncbi:hypothetical protein OIU84_013100 [Salix udensis]|uniref:Uncharacterized protein n=1 Tax=Salix udensis TaxID=889485 RepID=A0AAD6NU19_9ROSI|nr:hypothetical protein OIU84_013100 [Salix udensis]
MNSDLNKLASPTSVPLLLCCVLRVLLHEKIKERFLAEIINGGGRSKSTVTRVPDRFGSSIVNVVYHEWPVQLLPPLGKGEENHSHIEEDIEHLPQKSSPPHVKLKKNHGQSLPVLMPGDRVPKFIAMACPCEPPRTEMIAVQVQKPPPFPAPLY